MNDLVQEQGGEEDAFSEARTEAPDGKEGKVARALVISRLKEMEGDKDANGEAAVLNDWLKLANEEADLKKHIKDADVELDCGAYAKYPKLSETEIQTLVVDDKWLTG
jgi:type I restriction enzyme M protein